MPYIPSTVGTSDLFQHLNPRQREATTSSAHPLLIIAGAGAGTGTGKTNTLAHRVAHLVREGVAPERILLLTFTRRAALEMTRRASRIVAEAHRSVRLPWSGTSTPSPTASSAATAPRGSWS